MTIPEFKDKFKLVCNDTWVDALDAWFEAVGQMYLRKIPIPVEYEYAAGHADVIDEDSKFHTDFIKATNDQITAIADYLTRYMKVLKANGLNE